MISNKQKAIVHIAKSQLGLDEDTYRDILLAHGGVKSSRDLSYAGYLAVVKHFEESGFQWETREKREMREKVAHRGGAEGAPVKQNTKTGLTGQAEKKYQSQEEQNRPGMATDGQVKKIYALWYSMPAGYYDKGKALPALRGFLKKRFRVDHENFLTFEKAHQVIEAMKKIEARKTEGRRLKTEGDSPTLREKTED